MNNSQTSTSGRAVPRCIPLPNRQPSSSPVPLTTQLTSTSKYGRWEQIGEILDNDRSSPASDVSLTIVKQPEQQHRARYQTEGSRGAVKDREGNGFPIVQLLGYYQPTTLQVSQLPALPLKLYSFESPSGIHRDGRRQSSAAHVLPSVQSQRQELHSLRGEESRRHVRHRAAAGPLEGDERHVRLRRHTQRAERRRRAQVPRPAGQQEQKEVDQVSDDLQNDADARRWIAGDVASVFAAYRLQ
jgi:hypothetical protein